MERVGTLLERKKSRRRLDESQNGPRGPGSPLRRLLEPRVEAGEYVTGGLVFDLRPDPCFPAERRAFSRGGTGITGGE